MKLKQPKPKPLAWTVCTVMQIDGNWCVQKTLARFSRRTDADAYLQSLHYTGRYAVTVCRTDAIWWSDDDHCWVVDPYINALK